ncbi:MAG: D-2-hydroxyacid dehydrogenase family protein [Chloroflexi bacterium]|nr:D-2-hydroxyacid dehydrogenase family protein [Chloroflexota bacterium]
MIRIALLDDYQGVALQSADWTGLPDGTAIEAFHDHLDDEDAVAERLRGFDVVMAVRERTPFPRSLLERLPNLKMIANTGMRNAAIDMSACTELGILVCGTSGSSRSTMELTWALILALLRNLPRDNRAAHYDAWQETVGIGLDGKTLGLLGLGNIGSQMAEVARAFHMRIIAWSQNLTKERAEQHGAELVSKDALFSQADIVSIHLVLSDRTRGLVTARELGLMKSNAYLVNTSRGPIVDESALLDALRRRAIAGAGLDVYSVEPLPKDHPFLSLDNVVLTPHLGYVTRETYRNFYGQTVENIKSALDGAPQGVINPEVLGKRRQL